MAPSSIQYLRPKTEVFLNSSHSFTLHNQSISKTCQLYHKSYALSTVTISVSQFTISPIDHYCPISTHTKYISSSSISFPLWKPSRFSKAVGIKSTLFTTLPSRKWHPSYTFYSPPVLQPHWPSFWISHTTSLCSRSAPHLLFYLPWRLSPIFQGTAWMTLP